MAKLHSNQSVTSKQLLSHIKYCLDCFDIVKAHMTKKEYEGVIICKCQHGKPHHNGKYGNCTLDNCECQALDVVKTIYNGQITFRRNGK